MAANALALRPTNILPMDSEFEKMLRLAGEFAVSGVLPKGIPAKAAAVLLVIQQGYELGIPPAAALANISIVEGKPTLDAKMHRALIYRDHGDEAFRFVETSKTTCTIEYKRRGWREASRFTLTIDEIPDGLLRKDNWKNYPANMLRARATTFVSVMAFSDTTNGLYTPEELGAEVEVGPDGEPAIIARVEPATIHEITPQRPATPPPSTLPQTRNKARVVEDGPDERPALLKKLWALSVEYYGDRDKADAALHEWIKVGYPDATKDGKPSLRALTGEQMQEIIAAIESAPLDADISDEPAAEEAHLRSISAE